MPFLENKIQDGDRVTNTNDSCWTSTV